jgi:pimeloyl-ACP methyl ester carboxylesterase
LTRNSKDFDDLARHLSPRWRVLCPDYRGRGRSAYDQDWRRYLPQTYVADVGQLLAAIEVRRVVVIGTSLGGLLAMAMTAAMPAVLAGAVLNDIGPTIEAAGLVRIRQYLAALRPVRDWRAAALQLAEAIPDWPAKTDAEWLAVAHATYRQEADGWLRPDWDPAIAKPFDEPSGTAPPDLWALFKGFGNLPLLAVRGERSDILSAETLSRMHEAAPHMASVTVPGVGHAPALKQPVERAAIDALLAKVETAERPPIA